MITIALIDRNLTFCHGLKTMLEQVQGFSVVIFPPGHIGMEMANDPSVDILLADADLYQSYVANPSGREIRTPLTKTILLTMEPDELPGCQGEMIYIRKGSGKQEFEAMIRKLDHEYQANMKKSVNLK